MKTKIVIGVLSSKNNHVHRQACLQTWAKNLPSHKLDLVFLIGDPKRKTPTREGEILYCPCPDDYQSLPQKTRCFCQWVLKNYREAVLFKCDDDTYVHVQRLLQCDLTTNYLGCALENYASGGAGYLLSRKAALIVANQLTAPIGYEDLLVGKFLQQAGLTLTHHKEFKAWKGLVPQPNNKIITGHYVSPNEMVEIHRRFLTCF